MPTRPTVLIGDRDTPSARVLRRQTFFGELVPEASGSAMPVVYEEEDFAPAAPGFSSRRLKGDRQWLGGDSARQRRTMSAGGAEGTASFCPACGGAYYSGSGLGILSGRLCGLCSARYDRRRAGLEGMGGSNAESRWRRRLKPDTHDSWAEEGGPPAPRAGKGYPPADERPRPTSAYGFDGTLNRQRTGFVDRGLRRVVHAGNLTSLPASMPAWQRRRDAQSNCGQERTGGTDSHMGQAKDRSKAGPRAKDRERDPGQGQGQRQWQERDPHTVQRRTREERSSIDRSQSEDGRNHSVDKHNEDHKRGRQRPGPERRQQGRAGGGGMTGAARSEHSHKRLSRSIGMHDHPRSSVSYDGHGSHNEGHVTDRDRRLVQRREERQHRAAARRTHSTAWPQREVR